PPGAPRETFLNGVGQWLAAARPEVPKVEPPKPGKVGSVAEPKVEPKVVAQGKASDGGPEKPVSAVEDRPPETRRAPGGEVAQAVGSPPGAPRETFLNGVGQWLAAARPEVPKVEPPKPGKVGSVADPKVEPKVVAQGKASDGGPEKPVSAVEDRPPETRRAPGGEVAQAVGSPAGAPRETFLNGVGQWLASVRLESQKVDAVEGKKVGAGRPVAAEKPSTPTGTKFSGDAAVAAGYFATNVDRVAFHVIEAGPGETHKMELEAGTVGRKHGEGDEWAWLQLDSGLMGLVKKRQLRPAVGGEVVAFLSAESKNGKKSGKSGTEVRYVEVELPASPEAMPENDQALENPLFASGISPAPVATPEVSPPAPEMAASPAVSPPAPTAVAPVPAVLKSLPLQGALGPAGVITVPSPVPILP
ncbi:MAG: hypothetical protein KGS60_18740, partial [Verrucomicrobia bacterium]|nr:hypothetical protein [Verrucomicrobiota bacterium]